MVKYYCKECRAIFDKTEIIPGETRDVDDYDNDSCECGSENIIDIVEYTVEILDGRDGEVWALKYIQDDGIQKAIDRMELKSIPQSEYILENAAEFVQFVSDTEEDQRQENIRLFESAGIPIPALLYA